MYPDSTIKFNKDPKGKISVTFDWTKIQKAA